MFRRAALLCMTWVALATPLHAAEPVKVLFLGDQGHHRPIELSKVLIPALGARGIAVTYTEKLDDLNAANLAHYQALLLYANIDSITPEAEKALLDYVNGGGGFVPVHCASYCFRNSEPVVALIGGQFLRHGTEVFTAKVIAPDHPAVRGFVPFASWDETYVHTKLNPDRKDLMVREDKEGAQPYTWVREVGKGRVFYTALGHDERTWNQPQFQKLIELGIRWATRTAPPAPRTDLKPFEYVEATVPNYEPGKAGGTIGAPIGKMQKPLDPAESQKHLQLPPGFESKLFAADPQIFKPIAMNWDERGRLWVCETVDYPNNMQPAGEGHDRVSILEDTDGDGVADKFTVFADGLSIPTGIVCVNGGAIVSQAPHMLFLKSDGRDKCVEKKILFTGFGTSDTHAGPSNLRYGFDGWVWATVGYSGFSGKVGEKEWKFGQGVFRFKTDGSALEFITSTSNNTWGLGISETNQVFASTANGQHMVYVAIPNRYYESVRGWHGLGSEGIESDHKMFHPVTPNVRQVDVHGGYTAAANAALYTGRLFPQEYWNSVAFVAEPTGHLLHRCNIVPEGSGFAAHDGFNFAASDDEWTAPIAADTGPDGAVWMIDWYNFIVQHNPTPQGFKTGKGNAYEIPLRDKTHGRIYRLFPSGARFAAMPKLDPNNVDSLIDGLKSDTLFWRLTAQRLLIEKGTSDEVFRKLRDMVKDKTADPTGNNPAVVHALWTMHELGMMNKTVNWWILQGLGSRSPAVRRAALQVMPDDRSSIELMLSRQVLNDPDPQVRLAALLVLADVAETVDPPHWNAGPDLLAMLRKPENSQDHWMTDAATAAAAKHDVSFLAAVFAEAKAAPEDKRTAEAPNLLANASFEDEADGKPAGWTSARWGGEAKGSLANIGHTGQRSVTIESTAGADWAWSARVKVSPHTRYRLSGWVKTQNLDKGSGRGAMFNVHELQAPVSVVTPAITGTQDWTPLSIDFDSLDRSEITVNALFGGWGLSKGTAWYDDIKLQALDAGPPGSGAIEAVTRTVTVHYAQRGPVESIVATLAALPGGQTTANVLDGLTAGWPAGLAPKLSKEDEAKLTATMAGLSVGNQGRLATLADRWGRADLFAAQSAAAQKKLLAQLNDPAADASQRFDAAARLIALADTPQNLDAVLKLLAPQNAPDLSDALLKGATTSKLDSAGEALVKRWPELSPSARRSAIAALLRRPAWTAALLGAMDSGVIDRKDLGPAESQQLANHPDKALAERAKKLLAAGRPANPDKQKLVDKFMPAASGKGDVARGKVVFTEKCSVCHTHNGVGGKIGPELTGIGKNPRSEILVNILDPNRSVEGNFRLWVVTTHDGQAYAGRLDTESQTTIELLDLTGVKHALQRKDIKSMQVSPISIMPEGFESIGEADLANLLEYLTQPPAGK
jgi:putative membrane-bound dehydrogenase-like protein